MIKRLLSDPMILLLLGIMAFRSFTGGRYDSPQDWLLQNAILLPGIIIGLTFHEFAHAFMSDRLGDPTPRNQGRVTLNPLAHVDPIGLIALLFIGFGWGKPVEINPAYYRRRRRDELLVALAGVTMNLILAVLFMALLRGLNQLAIPEIVPDIVVQIVFINLVLMVFNLLPIPPLDGFTVVIELFNLRHTEFYRQVYDKGFVILMVLILLNVPSKILSPAVSFLFHSLVKLFFGV